MNQFLRRLLFLPDQGSTLALRLDTFHYYIFGASLIVFAFIAGSIIYYAIRYHRTSDSAPTPKIKPKIWMEVLYIGGPLAVFLLWFWIGFNDYIWAETPPPNSMDVYVTAKQWMWKFTYPNGLNSIDVLRVPSGRPVRLLITSRDVVHSFFVPSFRIKQDAVPGRFTQIWFQAVKPGRYRLMCAEYCGLDHSRMWGEVIAMAPADYDEWVQSQQGLVSRLDVSTTHEDATRGDSVMGGAGLRLGGTGPIGGARASARLNRELMAGPALAGQEERPRLAEAANPISDLTEQGRRVAAEKGCLKCHSVDGSAHIGPTWLDMYRREEHLEDGETVLADEAYLTKSMMQPGADIVQGYQDVMPVYQGRLSSAETAALLEYIKSLRSDRLENERDPGPIFKSADGR